MAPKSSHGRSNASRGISASLYLHLSSQQIQGSPLLTAVMPICSNRFSIDLWGCKAVNKVNKRSKKRPPAMTKRPLCYRLTWPHPTLLCGINVFFNLFLYSLWCYINKYFIPSLCCVVAEKTLVFIYIVIVLTEGQPTLSNPLWLHRK